MASLVFADTAGRRPGILARAANASSGLYRAWLNRRQFYRLGELTDAELQDIGLTRADLHVAVAQPFGLDPTVRLRSIVEARTEAA